MSEPCFICGDTVKGYRPYWDRLLRCENCGHCTANLELETLDTHALYQHDYFCGGEFMNYVRDRATFELHFEDRLADLARYRADGDLLEIGCAYGFFLASARKHYRVKGFDIAQQAVEYARQEFGLDARCGDFSELEYPAESADIITLWDTIEHLPNPRKMLANVASALRPGGYLFLTTGDIGALLPRIQKSRWRMIHPPTHLHYFTRSSMTKLVSNVGLTPIQIRSVGVRRPISQVLFGLLALGRDHPAKWFRGLADSRLGKVSFELNTHDIMLVVAQKGVLRS